jgi:DHA1 family tetracycline resistance protein-like MFS transporter
MMYRYGFDELMVGFTMAGVGLSAMIVQGGLIGPAVKRFGERATLLIGLAFGILGFAAFGLAPTGLVFWLGIPVLALWGFANSAALGLMSHLVSSTEQGQLQGANASLMGIASLLGPGLFTQTFALFIGVGGNWHLPGAPFLLAALFVVVATFVAWRTA